MKELNKGQLINIHMLHEDRPQATRQLQRAYKSWEEDEVKEILVNVNTVKFLLERAIETRQGVKEVDYDNKSQTLDFAVRQDMKDAKELIGHIGINLGAFRLTHKAEALKSTEDFIGLG